MPGSKRQPRVASLALSLPAVGAATVHVPFDAEGTRRSCVLLVRSPLELPGEAELSEALASHLNHQGMAVITLPGSSPAIAPAESLAVHQRCLELAAAHPSLNPDALGVVGIGAGAPIAACLAARVAPVARLCLFGPLAPELTARRPTGSAQGAVPEAVMTALAGLQPLKAAVAHQGPTLILHGAADTFPPPEHAYAYAAAREFTLQLVDFHLIAFADHACTRPADRETACRVVTEFFRAMV